MVLRVVSDVLLLVDLDVFGDDQSVVLSPVEVSLEEVEGLIFSVLEAGLLVDGLEHVAPLPVHGELSHVRKQA